ncbi:MAG: hypothetical protein WBS54_02430 [Acidobacteriota bacterium]
MNKRAAKLIAMIAGMVVAISAIQYLWIAIVWSPGDLAGWASAVKEQRPVHLVIRATDQFGSPAVGFPVEIEMWWMSRYFWIFPLLARHQSSCLVKTDQNGVAKLSFSMRRVATVQFREGNTACYIFPEGKNNPYDLSFNNNPRGLFAMKQLDRKGQVIDMKVLRHDAPAKLTPYRPEIPGQTIGTSAQGIDALDENVFTLDVTGNRFLRGRQEGDVVLTITNAEEACKAAQARLMHESTFQGWVPLQVTLESQRGTELQQADMQIVTFAPKEGYKQSIVYQMTIEKAPPSGWPRAESPEDWYKLLESTPAEARYQVMFGAGGIDRGIFLRGPNASWYGILHIMVNLQPGESKLLVRTSGAYNPDGSTNLWKSSAVDWHWY